MFLRLIREAYVFALQSVLANKLRTLLTILGITIGIFSIIIVFTIVDSIKYQVKSSIESLGSNVVFVQKWPWAFNADYEWWKYMLRPQPSLKEYNEIKKRSYTAAYITYGASTNTKFEYEDEVIDPIAVAGVSEDFNKVFSFEIAEGRFFSPSEINNGQPVAIIGGKVAQEVFESRSGLDEKVKIGGYKMKVIGILKPEGKSIGNSFDDAIIIPVYFFSRLVSLHSDQANPYIAVRARENISNAEMKDELTGIMRSLRQLKPSREDDFAINETSLISKEFESLFAIVSIAGWIIGGFSLLVGGFGIANIMFVSVKERTQIIGIQKALGAKKSFILFQFLFEAIFLSVFGGIAGLLLVFLSTILFGSSFEITLSAANIVLGLGVSVFIGLVAGIIPANSASKLDPVEAIRQN